jgi:ABC-type uncharacterized transport system substrate-binding protein
MQLRGARPAELPVEAPTELEFVINPKIAQALIVASRGAAMSLLTQSGFSEAQPIAASLIRPAEL